MCLREPRQGINRTKSPPLGDAHWSSKLRQRHDGTPSHVQGRRLEDIVARVAPINAAPSGAGVADIALLNGFQRLC